MKVAFICSGNNGVNAIVQAQYDSLVRYGLDTVIIPIIGKGILGYLANIPSIRTKLNQYKPDVVHAHYSFCGILASLSTRRPVVTSLMGSDVISSGFWRKIIRYFALHQWDATIVKSEDMKTKSGLRDVHVIPNGVDIETFRPLDQIDCRSRLGWGVKENIVLFAADPKRAEKNFALAQMVMSHPGLHNVVLKVVHNVKHEDIPTYLNAANVLLLTSNWEGSPNVVKEAMACNLSIVSTDVGDVKWLLSQVEGSFVDNADASKLSKSLLMAISFRGLSRGRQRLLELGLDSGSVCDKLFRVYMGVVR